MPRTLLNLTCIAFLSLIAFTPVYARAEPASSYRQAFEALDEKETGLAERLTFNGGNPILNKVLQAELMAQPGNDYSFGDLASFITENPDWPTIKGIVMIAEQKIPESASPQQVINWFESHPPLTSAGFDRYIDALEATRNSGRISTLVRQRWIEKDLSKAEQEAFLLRFNHLLTPKDHQERLSRLLWDNDIAASRAMFRHVNADWEALAESRIALANDTNNAPALLKKVPPSLSRNEGLLFDRLHWRRTKDMDEDAIEILLHPPQTITHPDKWWDERNVLMRRLIEKKDFKRAYQLASHHGLKSGFDYLQAEFLSGWLALRFLHQTQTAHRHFTNFINEANTPISRSRGYYWLGRTYEAAGQKQDARQAYETAGTMNTTFYGQLALAELGAQPTIRAEAEPAIPENVRQRFFQKDMVQAIEQLYRIGVSNRAEKFFRASCEAAKQRVDFALLFELAYKIQRPDWAVKAAKAANQKNFIVPGASFPTLKVDMPTPPEKALTHALIRQESQFQTDAKSAAGAQGLMQLLPSTAKEVAQKIGEPYRPENLMDPEYNILLGTSFIQRQIDAFDGSYILALAGYNAGPRRVREWISLFGDPRESDVDAIDWIELIPIYETRNYVQRIIENLQFYRAKLGGGQAPLQILQDLKR